MNKRIISLIYNKHQESDANGEFQRKIVLSVGMVAHSPSCQQSEIISIEKKGVYPLRYDVLFKNGEAWQIHPVPPFDVGLYT